MPVSVRRHLSWAASFIFLAVTAACAQAQDSGELTVHVDQPGATIGPMFFGLMTEEINHAYDGGLYAELIQNRTFQDSGPGTAPGAPLRSAVPIHWSVVGSGKVSTDPTNPVNPALPISLRLDVAGAETGVENDGFWGIAVRP